MRIDIILVCSHVCEVKPVDVAIGERGSATATVSSSIKVNDCRLMFLLRRNIRLVVSELKAVPAFVLCAKIASTKTVHATCHFAVSHVMSQSKFLTPFTPMEPLQSGLSALVTTLPSQTTSSDSVTNIE